VLDTNDAQFGNRVRPSNTKLLNCAGVYFANSTLAAIYNPDVENIAWGDETTVSARMSECKKKDDNIKLIV